MPFIIKAYNFGLAKEETCRFCSSAESFVLRHRLIGTRADMRSRLSDVYQNFTKKDCNINPVIEIINKMKKTRDWWWAYWNTTKLKEAINGKIEPSIAKYLLWKYENHLQSCGKKGYTFTRFDDIISPELEHIAPQTPTNNESISAAGYCEYDDEFVNEYIDCLGNYLLLSKSHNCSVGNKPFSEKRDSYKHLLQQLEIREMTKNKIIWNKENINIRHKKIVEFIIDNL
jgi:hypothetical protein